MINSTDQYGATHQSATVKYIGNEGQQAAILLKIRILVEFGKLDALRFITTLLTDVMKEIDDLAKEGGTITITDHMRIREAKPKRELRHAGLRLTGILRIFYLGWNRKLSARPL